MSSMEEHQTEVLHGNMIRIPADFVRKLGIEKYIFLTEDPDNRTIIIFPEVPLRLIPAYRVDLPKSGRRRNRFTLPGSLLQSNSKSASFFFGKTITLVLHPEKRYIEIVPRITDEERRKNDSIKPQGS